MSRDRHPREKKWSLLAVRSNKLHRARQLGFPYPRESELRMMERETLNVLFVCSMNQWRSPTAEKVYADTPLINVRSRGTSHKARQTITANDVNWADIVIVMENKHRQRLASTFSREMQHKETHVLDIPDQYKFMDPELVDEIQSAVNPILDDFRQ